MSRTDPYRDQIATYALGALEGLERRELEAHLRHCPECRLSLAEAMEVVELLPRAVEPLSPSPETRRLLFRRIHSDLAALRSRRSMPGILLSFSHLRLMLGVLVLVAILALGALSMPSLSRLQREREMQAIMTAPNARTVTLSAPGQANGARGELMMRPGDTSAVLIVDGLTPPRSDQAYEFWVGREDKMLPAGLFGVDSAGHAELLVSAAESFDQFDRMGVTIENKPGEAAPKGPIIIRAEY